MGYARTPQPHVIAAAESALVYRFVSEREIAAVMGDADPFLIGVACEWSPTGAHVPAASCGEVVCCYCSRIFWR
jgi:hypothetical protein